jgi:hypothetical protein
MSSDVVRAQVSVRRAPDAVFALVAAPLRQAEWHPSVISITPIGDFPARPGDRFVRRRRTPLGAMDFQVGIAAVDPGARRYEEVLLDSDLKDSRTAWTVAAGGQDSTVTAEMSLQVSGAWQLFKPVVIDGAGREIREGVEGLRAFLEQEKPAGGRRRRSG